MRQVQRHSWHAMAMTFVGNLVHSSCSPLNYDASKCQLGSLGACTARDYEEDQSCLIVVPELSTCTNGIQMLTGD
jgi:hypothetical protein